MSSYKRKDHYYERAKAEGKASRAIYKLKQLNDKLNLLKKGQKAIDLGAWPGGWLEELSQIVGPTGKIVGIDLVEITIALPKNISTLVGDVLDEEIPEKLITELGGKADVLVSDLSPKLTGIAFRDAARWEELALIAIEIASLTLKQGGNILMKAFHSPEADSILKNLRNEYKTVKSIKPKATRKGSSEFYIAGIDKL